MSNSTFIPESGLTTENNVNAQANVAPRRTAPGISAPPAILKEADKVSDELSALGNSIDNKGHPVGRYNSFFHDLLTWKHPRASGLILTTLLTSIIFTQFVNVPKFGFRILWIALASSTALEVAGRFVFRNDQGLVSQFAPQEYFTISRQSMDLIFDEVFSLVNFAVTEFQRLLFARNVQHTSIAFVLSFVAYNLIKFLPLWGLIMIGLILAFTLPPVYVQNQATIDAQLNKASELGAAHYNNAVDVASKHANAATEKARLTAIDLGNKAGVDVNKFISGPGPVQSSSVTDNLAAQPKLSSSSTTTTTTTVSSSSSHNKVAATPIADEFSRAPAVPSGDGVYVHHESTQATVQSGADAESYDDFSTSAALPRGTTGTPAAPVEAVPSI